MTEHASRGFITRYALSYLGIWMALLTPAVVSLALRVNTLDPVHKESQLSWIMGIGAVVAMVANPLAGYLSDRTRSRFGMRTPWLVGGMGVGLVGLYAMATGNLAVVGLGWWITQAGLNAVLAASVAVLPDHVPVRQRGVVAGVLGVSMPLGVVAGVFVVEASPSPVWMFMAPGLLCAASIIVFTVTYTDRRLDALPGTGASWRSFLASVWIDPRRAPDFAWAFVSRFLLFIGMATLLTYQVFYLIDHLGFTDAEVPGAMTRATLVNTGTAIVGSAIGGWLSDRWQRRKVFVWVSAVIFAVSLAMIGTADGFTAFQWGNAVNGLAQGVYLSVDLALVTDVLPNREADAAKDLGIFNLASALPQSVAPAIAPIFLAIGSGDGSNYAALFVAAAACSALGALAVLPIKAVR